MPHWTEIDQSFGAEGEYAGPRRALMIWPARRLASGRRYIVAIRALRDKNGGLVKIPDLFWGIRAGLPVGTPHRRASINDALVTLADAGVGRLTVRLAWDFTTGSRGGLTDRFIAGRDDMLRRIGDQGPSYSITNVVDAPTNTTARRIEGIMFAPMYLNQARLASLARSAHPVRCAALSWLRVHAHPTAVVHVGKGKGCAVFLAALATGRHSFP